MFLHIRRHQEGQEEEAGVVLVAFAFFALTLIGFVGLAIDSGNLYVAKLNAQGAADAAALAALGMVVSQIPEEDALRGARQAARSNLVANRHAEERFNFTPDDNTGGIRAAFGGGVMTVRIDLEVPLFFLGGLPGWSGGATRTVSAQGRAAFRPANISLVLDTSNSMACPQVSGDPNFACPCSPNCDQGDASGAKIVALRNAAVEFTQNFDPDDNSINLVAFGHGAELLVPFEGRRGQRGYDFDDIREAIDGLTARGATNTYDGLFTAYLDARESEHLDDLSYVLFSDGAPTASRFHFARNAIHGSSRNRFDVRNNVVNSRWSWADYDFISWGVLDRGVTPVPNRLYWTPPPEQVGRFSRYWNKRTSSGVDPLTPPAFVVGSGRGAFASRLDLANQEMFLTAANRQLITRPLVHMPDGSTRQVGRRALWDGNNFDWDNWIDGSDHLWMYADMAVMMSDFIREQNARIYVIGFGPAASDAFEVPGNAGVQCEEGGNVQCTDPYQNAAEPQWRKDILNRRLALTSCGWNDPAFFSEGVLPIQTQLIQNPRQHGEYYRVSNAENLRSAFDKIALSIRMRRASNL